MDLTNLVPVPVLLPMVMPEKPPVVSRASRRNKAAEPQKNEPFHLSRPRCVTE